MPSRSCSETQCSVNDAAKSEHSTEKDAETIVTSVDQALPPDGGSTAWLTVAGSWMVIFCTFGYLSAYGVYEDFYTREFLSHKTPSEISWIGSFQMCLLYAPGVFVGYAFDLGFFHHVMILGSTIYVFSMFMLSLAQQNQYYQVFLSHSLGMGIGVGLLFLPALTVLGHHFRRHRALAMGIASTGASMGGIIFPIMLNRLQPLLGFHQTVRISAGIAGVLLLVANLLMRTKSMVKSKETQGNIPRPAIAKIFSDLAYTTSIFAAFLTNLGLFFPYFYTQLYAININVPATTAFYSLAILNGGSFAGRIVIPYFADRYGVYNLLIPALFTSAALDFLIFAIRDFGGVAAFGVFFGISSGAYISLIPSLLAQLCSHPGEQGIRMGVAFSVVAIAMLIGTPINGALLTGDQTHEFTWWKAIVFSGVCVSAGAAMMTVSRVLFVKKKGIQGWVA